MTTTAIVAAAGAPAFADSGSPCVMQAGACIISSVGISPPPPADGQGGDPGGAAADLSTILSDPHGFTNSGLLSPLNMTSTGGNGASGSPNNSAGGGNGGQGGAGGAIDLTVVAPGTDPIIFGTSDGVASGVTIISNGGTAGGGAAGVGGVGTSATGGQASAVTVGLDGDWTSSQGGGLAVQANGGAGGHGGNYLSGLQEADGVDGGTGGNAANDPASGLSVDVTINGHIQGQTSGAHIFSAGGTGGEGGNGASGVLGGGQGGDGGTGGNGGNVGVTLSSGAEIDAYGDDQGGLWVQSLGGKGGTGGRGHDGGNGGQGGNAGNVAVSVNGTIHTAVGSASPGVLAQSLGSVGGGGGHAGDWTIAPTSGDGCSGSAPMAQK